VLCSAPSIETMQTCMYDRGKDCLLKSSGVTGERNVIVIWTLPPTSMVKVLSVEVYSKDVCSTFGIEPSGPGLPSH
jgi:hypothetical protein